MCKNTLVKTFPHMILVFTTYLNFNTSQRVENWSLHTWFIWKHSFVWNKKKTCSLYSWHYAKRQIRVNRELINMRMFSIMESGLRDDEVSHIIHAGKMHYECFWVNSSGKDNGYFYILFVNTQTWCDIYVGHEHILWY